MVIIYRDNIGYIARAVNGEITFYNNMAYFESNGEDYKITVKDILGITNKTEILTEV